MIISLIAAMDRNRGIGFDRDIPWFTNGKSTIEGDMERFRNLTMGHPVIMGRTTYLSIGRALRGRTNIVLTHEVGFPLPDAIVVNSWKEAKREAGGVPGSNEVFVIGGGKVFREVLPKADRMYLTVIDKDFVVDTYFPEYDINEWNILDKNRFIMISKNTPPVHFIDLERKTAHKASSQR
jgi:dihydrofolate reductase